METFGGVLELELILRYFSFNRDGVESIYPIFLHNICLKLSRIITLLFLII